MLLVPPARPPTWAPQLCVAASWGKLRMRGEFPLRTWTEPRISIILSLWFPVAVRRKKEGFYALIYARRRAWAMCALRVVFCRTLRRYDAVCSTLNRFQDGTCARRLRHIWLLWFLMAVRSWSAHLACLHHHRNRITAVIPSDTSLYALQKPEMTKNQLCFCLICKNSYIKKLIIYNNYIK